jgi:hypothetical protein
MRKLQNKTNVTPPGGSFIYGDVKDNPGNNTGTPLDRDFLGDYWQFFERLLDKSLSITANNLPENNTNGFQLFESLQEVIAQYKSINSYNVTTTLTDDDFDVINIMDVNGNSIFNLPNLAATNLGKKMLIVKIGSGTLTVSPQVGEPVYPSATINMADGDMILLVNVGVTWLIIDRYSKATETTKGVAEIATQSETDTGTDDERFVTPLKLATTLPEQMKSSGWQSVTYAANVSTAAGEAPAEFYSTHDGEIAMRGVVEVSSAASSGAVTLFTLPIGARPQTYNQRFPVYFTEPGAAITSFNDASLWTIRVGTNGDVVLEQFIGGFANWKYDLSTIRFKAIIP